MTLEQIDEARRQTACLLAPKLPFGAQGYREHYIAIFGWSLPPFAWEWIQRCFEEYEKGERYFLIKAFRGATKSTVFTVGLATYILSKFPHYGILAVQKSDNAATQTSASIANIIEFNAGWKTMYPHLVPDKEQKWSASGYEIKDTSIPYEEWRQKVLKERTRDAGFIGLGWESGSIVGMHPRVLFIDDILDENNTNSERELNAVQRSLTSNILQTLNRPPDQEPPLCFVSYTPWYKNDCYAYLESTGVYKRIAVTPVVKEVDEDGFVWRGKTYEIAWGKTLKDPVKYLDAKLSLFGEMDFARMMLLNLEAAEGMNLKREWLHDYVNATIGATWPVYFGIDYASSSDKLRDKKRDYFSLSMGKAIPGGGVVLFDGFRDHLSRAESEIKVRALASIWNPVLIGFEKTVGSQDAMDSLISSGLPIMPCPGQGKRIRPKGDMFEGAGGLGPTFQFSRAWISDAQAPFLKAFRDEWVQWPNGQHDDTLDSTYWMLYVAQPYLMVPTETDAFLPKQEETNPYNSLGRR
jgi:hypothetical protein